MTDTAPEKQLAELGGDMAARRRSVRYAIISSVTTVLAANCLAGNIVTLAALKLGADNFLLGVLSLFMFLPFTLSMLTLSSMERIGKKRLLVRWWTPAIGVAGLYLLLPVADRYFSDQMALVFLFTIVMLRSSTNALGMTAWMPLLHDVAPEASTGRFFARLRFFWLGAGFLFLVGCKFFLSEDSPWWKFELIFLFGMIMAAVRVAAVVPITESRISPLTPRLSLWQRCGELLRDERLRTLLFYLIGINFAGNFTRFHRIKWLKEIGYGDDMVMLASGAMLSLGAMVSLGIWGRLADRHGNRSLLSITTAGLIAVMGAWLLVEKSLTGTWIIMGLYILEGALFFGNGIATTRVMFHGVSEQKQYLVSMLSLVVFLATGVGPFLSGITLNAFGETSYVLGALHMNSYQVLMVINGVLFIWPHWLRRRLRTRGEARTSEVISFMAQSLRGAIAPFMRIGNDSGEGKGKDTDNGG